MLETRQEQSLVRLFQRARSGYPCETLSDVQQAFASAVEARELPDQPDAKPVLDYVALTARNRIAQMTGCGGIPKALLVEAYRKLQAAPTNQAVMAEVKRVQRR